MKTSQMVVLAFLALALAPAVASAQETLVDCGLPGDERCEEWIAQHDTGDNFEAPTAFAASPSGSRVFVGGRTTSGGLPGNDVHIAAFNGDGTAAWSARYGTAAVRDLVRDLAVSPDEDVVAAAAVQGYVFNTEGEAIVLAFDAGTGERRWASSFGGPFAEMPTSIVFSPDGQTVFASAVAYNMGPDQEPDTDQLIAAFDSGTGERLWQTRVASPRDEGSDWVHELTVSPDGETIFAAGYYQSGSQTLAASVAALEVEDGDLAWLSTFPGGNPNTVNAAEAVQISPDGQTVFASGYSQEPGAGSGVIYMTLAYDAHSGQLRWSDRFTPNGQKCIVCTPVSIEVSPAGDRVFVAGDASMTNASGVPSRDFVVIAYDAATGTKPWVQTYDALSRHQYAARLALSPDGQRVHVAGITHTSLGSAGSHTSPTVATFDAASGTLLWDAEIGPPVLGPGTDPALPMAAATEGSLFLSFVYIQPRTSTTSNSNYGVAAFESA